MSEWPEPNGMPQPIRQAIESASKNPASGSVACQIFLEDTRGLPPRDRLAQARLEHAVARAELDAWRHGLGSAESVGRAYAALGERVESAARGRDGSALELDTDPSILTPFDEDS